MENVDDNDLFRAFLCGYLATREGWNAEISSLELEENIKRIKFEFFEAKAKGWRNTEWTNSDKIQLFAEGGAYFAETVQPATDTIQTGD